MEEKANILESLLERAEDYGKTSLELFKLRMLNKILNVVSSIISRSSAILFFLMCFLAGTIGVAFLLGDVMGKLWYGFFIIAGFYGLIGFVIYLLMNKWIKKVVSKFILKHIAK